LENIISLKRYQIIKKCIFPKLSFLVLKDPVFNSVNFPFFIPTLNPPFSDSARITILTIGVIDHRKNILNIVQSLTYLSSSTQSKITYFIVGPWENDQSFLLNEIKQIISRNSFLDLRIINKKFNPVDAESWIRFADLIMIPYTGFYGSSSIFSQAFFWNKSIIITKNSLLHKVFKKNINVHAVKNTSPKDIAKAVNGIVNSYTENMQNLIMNGYNIDLRDDSLIKEKYPEYSFFVDPIANDATLSLGAAKFHYYSRTKDTRFEKINNIYFGPKYNIKERLNIN
jgi:hypothetical protein